MVHLRTYARTAEDEGTGGVDVIDGVIVNKVFRQNNLQSYLVKTGYCIGIVVIVGLIS